jgi:uncharacterized membrane protein
MSLFPTPRLASKGDVVKGWWSGNGQHCAIPINELNKHIDNELSTIKPFQ